MTSWYYVQGSERVGPVEESDLKALILQGVLGDDSYVWRKGFENWQRMGEVGELESLFGSSGIPAPLDEIPAMNDDQSFDWSAVNRSKRLFTIRIGLDRGTDEVEYGPYSLEELKRAYDEKRINGKTFLFAPGMNEWMFLADIPIYQDVFEDMPPVIDEIDRRQTPRRPFVARMLFHNNADVFEGTCRDISLGGLQVLASNLPVKLGEKITLNVHPDNSGHSFTASGQVVRILEGSQGFSLRFENLGDDANSAIYSYISGGK